MTKPNATSRTSVDRTSAERQRRHVAGVKTDLKEIKSQQAEIKQMLSELLLFVGVDRMSDEDARK
jgi:hypothetical protein